MNYGVITGDIIEAALACCCTISATTWHVLRAYFTILEFQMCTYDVDVFFWQIISRSIA